MPYGIDPRAKCTYAAHQYQYGAYAVTKDTILAAALDLASTHPGRYDRLTRSEIAKRANCATGSINYYFTDMAGLRDAVVAAAIPARAHRVVAAAIMDGHPAVAGLTASERQEALAGL